MRIARSALGWTLGTLVACGGPVVIGGELGEGVTPGPASGNDAAPDVTLGDGGTDASDLDAPDLDAISVEAGPSGVLDKTFAGTGYIARTRTAGPNSSPEDVAKGVAIDASGRIVVAGFSADVTGTGRAVAWRIEPDGTFDNAFGTAGAWVAPAIDAGAGGSTSALGIVVQGAGLPRLAGMLIGNDGTTFMTAWGLTTSGTLDPTFGGSGVITRIGTSGGSGDLAYAIASDAVHGVVLAGSSRKPNAGGGGWDMVAWHYTAAGAPSSEAFADATGGDSLSLDSATAVLVDPNGSVVVVGNTTLIGGGSAGRKIAAIWRFTSAGAVDTSFNGTGHVILNGIAGNAGPVGLDIGKALAIDAQGRIVFGGWAEDAQQALHGFVGRLTTAGALDATFGSGGLVVFDPPPGELFTLVNALTVDSHGRIIAVGGVQGASRAKAAAWRLSSAGVLDPTYGASGVFMISGTADGVPAAQGDSAYGVAVDTQDRAVLVGGSATANDGSTAPGTPEYMAVWRLTP